jgi:hypothetical protein
VARVGRDGCRPARPLIGVKPPRPWVGVLLTTDWQKDFGMPPNRIKGGGVAGSGVFDLEPVRLSVRSNYVKFTDEDPKREPQNFKNQPVSQARSWA